jgi:hypothetical protein
VPFLGPFPVYLMIMSIESILAESRALTAALESLQGRRGMGEVLSLVGPALDAREDSSDVEDTATCAAMGFITGRPVSRPSFRPAKRPDDRHIFETVAKSWILWASRSDPEEALNALQALRIPSGKVSALHLMALSPWKGAVEALLKKDASEARRLFLRASELGSQFGTESNPVVQWSFAASFFFSPSIVL